MIVLNINNNKNDGVSIDGIYFHGKLEQELGCDLLNIVGANLISNICKNQTQTIDTHVLINNEFKAVKMFLWETEL